MLLFLFVKMDTVSYVVLKKIDSTVMLVKFH